MNGDGEDLPSTVTIPVLNEGDTITFTKLADAQDWVSLHWVDATIVVNPSSAIGADIDVSSAPLTMDFDRNVAHATSASLSIGATGPAGTAVAMSLSVGGSDAAEFVLSDTMAVLQPGQTLDLQIVWKPTAPAELGERDAVLRINHNSATIASPVEIYLDALALPVELSVFRLE